MEQKYQGTFVNPPATTGGLQSPFLRLRGVGQCLFTDDELVIFAKQKKSRDWNLALIGFGVFILLTILNQVLHSNIDSYFSGAGPGIIGVMIFGVLKGYFIFMVQEEASENNTKEVKLTFQWKKLKKIRQKDGVMIITIKRSFRNLEIGFKPENPEEFETHFHSRLM